MKICGIVIEGKQKGKELGFPTVNLALKKPAESGIYAGRVYFNGNGYKSAIFIGEGNDTLEAHILNFKGDLYGKEIEVEIGKKIREVMKFENDEEMKEQIKKDLEQIKCLPE